MKGLMQDHPLLISSIFEHAINNYPTQEIVSNSVEGVFINILMKTGVIEQNN